MKSRFIVILTLLMVFASFAQNSINYKAVIKDNLGNVVANQTVALQFSILKGVAQTNVYTEIHSPTTDANGIVIVNIGEGTPTSGSYTTITWGSDEHHLNVQVNIGSGLVDMGTTEFKAVPYALNVSGLEALDEGNGIGWRLKDRLDVYYGDIGNSAVDLSISSSVSNRGATGDFSVALGSNTTASGSGATAFGFLTLASGSNSAAFGSSSIASGLVSTAFGWETIASGNYSTAIGKYNVDDGLGSFMIGNGLDTNNRDTALVLKNNGNFIIGSHQLDYDGNTNHRGRLFYNKVKGAFRAGLAFNQEWDDVNVGNYSSAFGSSCIASGDYSLSTGFESVASGNYAVAFGNGGIATNLNSFAHGNFALSTGIHSIAIGRSVEASADYAIALGNNTEASAVNAVSIGDNTIASGVNSTAFGDQTLASGDNSSAFGYGTIASGNTSTAFGIGTDATGNYSFAIGDNTLASGNWSTAMGHGTIASGLNSVAMGSYNISSTSALLSIGNGSSIATRSNALTILQNGNVGISRSDPQVRLHVVSGTDASLSDGSGFFLIGFQNGANIVMDTNEIQARSNGAASTLFLQQDGGNVAVNGAVVHTSDRRLKKDISTLEYGLKDILKLNPVSYKWKDKPSQTQKSLGLIAQELEEVISELVTVEDDAQKTLHVNYTELIPVLIKAIQEQQEIIDNQDSRIKGLSAELQELHTLNYRLKEVEKLLKTTHQ